jgi:polysaccharide pyruvyl transferase WcaK-like protein
LHRSVERCDLFFDIGAGDSFSDIYGWRRFGLILASKWVAAKRGPLVMSPQTIGPFATRRSRIAATAVMKKARTVYARDEQSFAVLKQMGLGDRSRLTTDVAFALPYALPADKGQRDLTGRVRVGLNVSALLYRRDIAPGDRIAMTVNYPKLIDEVIVRLLNNPRVELHLVPHVLAIGMEHEDDYAVAEALKAKYPAMVLPSRFAGPSAAKSYVADLDLLIGSRMHATVAALSSNTAVLPFGYSRKFSGLFGSLGYPMVGDLTSQDEPALLALLDMAMADLPGLTAAATRANIEAQSRLNNYRAYLDDLFADLVPA